MRGHAYVRACYQRFRTQYFAPYTLPDFDDLDFEFVETKGEWGAVSWDQHGNPHLALDPALQQDSGLLRQKLLHEQIHLALGPKVGHGRRFWAEVDRINGLGAAREYF